MAARVATALIAAAMLAALWACPAAAASASRAQSRAAASASASASAKRVKYYIVPQPTNGQAVALYGIAARTLGDTHRYLEIFTLNKGRLQPDGRRLENPRIIDPGWILRLPADASGPGVRFGRLPRVSRSATAPASHRPSQPAGSGAATHFTLGPAGTGSAVVVGGALVLFAIAGLAVVVRRRRAGGARRRKHSHARRPQPQGGAGNDAAATAPDVRAADPRWPGPDPRFTDHPSFPSASYPGAASTGPGRRHPDPRLTDHPSFPGGSYPGGPDANPRFTDHPSFPGGSYPGDPGADPRWPGPDPRLTDHPSFPGADPRYPGPHHPVADHSSWPGGAGGPRRQAPPEPQDGRPSRAASPQAAGARNAAGIWVPPDAPPGGAADRMQQPSTQVARTAGAATQTYQDVAFGDGRLQVVLTPAPAAGWAGATGLGARQDLVQLAGGQTAQLADAVRRDAGEFQHAHSLWLAGRILSGAESQAAEIRQEAYEQAAAMRAAAEREATEARQQAAVMRATAEADAADLLTSARTMSSELGRVAAYVTETLTSPGLLPITKPAARPETKPGRVPTARPAASPAAEPATRPARPASKPAARPGAKPSAGPEAEPAARPGAKPTGRQIKSLRKMVIALVAVFLVGAVSGTTEIALHGFSFFLFRNTGAGAGNSRNLDENQGPGQQDAPGAHHKAHVGTESKTGSKTSKPGSKTGSKPASKAGNKPGSKPGNKPASKAGNKPGSKAGNKPGSKAGNRPGGTPGNKPASKPGGKTGRSN
jgi:hypothetical protein